MTSKRNRKKNNHNKVMAQSGELADDYQQPSGLTGDPSQSRNGDQGGQGSDNQLAVPFNQRELPGMTDRGQITHDKFASTLSALSVTNSGINAGDLSKNDASRNAVQEPLETNGGSGVPTENEVSKDSGIHTTSVKKKSQKATMEVVTDDEDIVSAVVPPSPKTTREGPDSTPQSVRSQMPPSSSPYPVSQGLRSSTDGSMLDKVARTQRRQEKQRRNRADSIESAEMHMAAARRLAERPAVGSETGSNPRPNQWDDVNVCIAAEALARERGENEPPEEYNRWVAAWKRNETRLRRLCEQDDFNVAIEILECDVQETADHELAEAMDRKEKQDALAALEQAKSAQRAIDREEAEAAALEKQAAEKRLETNKRKLILAEYAHKKQASAAARSVARSQSGLFYSVCDIKRL
ncbi:hypothetical protein B0H17DRAFT_1138162 [Mycena rosella]|uniref:Uncharacterized protein n=1 Tax=Mycena rosella TaxID=1033263 RepID=A0AAD7D7C0_MYCRO|nr:hypothetical protein B0H17DRAFT_1138162 [Mycena rosella]